jgi:hypothetical protein
VTLKTMTTTMTTTMMIMRVVRLNQIRIKMKVATMQIDMYIY